MLVYDDRQSINRLRWRWFLVAAAYGLTLFLGYQFLLQIWQSGSERQWLVTATLLMVVQMVILWRSLPHNHPPSEERLFPFLGYGNGMTLTRGLCTCLLAGFLFLPRPTHALAWAPAILYSLERLIDYFDGYVARITRQETRLGAILDIEFDGLGILIAIALAIQYGQLPLWYLVLGLARQLFVAGLWWRKQRDLPVLDLPPSDHRRLIAGFQTSFISVTLWPILSPQITLPTGYLFAIPLIFSFGRDWLVVSTLVDANSTLYQKSRCWIKQLFEEWLPLVARFVGVALTVWLLWQAAPDFARWATALSAMGWGAQSFAFVVVLICWGTAIPMLALGMMGRVAALAIFGLACLDILATGLRWEDNGLLLVCAVIVVHLGSGRRALWRPEEPLLHMRLGDQVKGGAR
jgi:CDP-diacylglycerol--glycerol-3-phosphate 3-phosphatidyltransferase